MPILGILTLMLFQTHCFGGSGSKSWMALSSRKGVAWALDVAWHLGDQTREMVRAGIAAGWILQQVYTANFAIILNQGRRFAKLGEKHSDPLRLHCVALPMIDDDLLQAVGNGHRVFGVGSVKEVEVRHRG